jgi:hypothetical protein
LTIFDGPNYTSERRSEVRTLSHCWSDEKRMQGAIELLAGDKGNGANVIRVGCGIYFFVWRFMIALTSIDGK